MTNNISPEEKLLKLIRNPKKQDLNIDQKPSVSTVNSNQRPINLFFPLILEYLSFLNKPRILWAGLIISFVYLALSFIYPWVFLKNIKLPQLKETKAIELKTEPIISAKPYEFYLKGISGRQIFSSSAIQGTEKPISNTVSGNSLKDINLVGIITGEDPQAIIENKKTNKTYYLRKGQFFEEFQLEDIQAGKIILNLNGQRLELYL